MNIPHHIYTDKTKDQLSILSPFSSHEVCMPSWNCCICTCFMCACGIYMYIHICVCLYMCIRSCVYTCVYRYTLKYVSMYVEAVLLDICESLGNKLQNALSQYYIAQDNVEHVLWTLVETVSLHTYSVIITSRVIKQPSAC